MADENTNQTSPEPASAATGEGRPAPAAPDPLDFSEPEDGWDIPDQDESSARGGAPREEEGGADKDHAPPPPAFPQELLDRAGRSGMTEAEARAFGPERLGQVLSLMDRQLARQSMTQQGQRPQQTPPQQQAPPQGLPAYELKLNKDVYDPELVEAVEGLSKHYHGQVNALAAQVQQLLGHHQAAAGQAFAAQFDGWLGELGDGYHDALGKGALADVRGDPKAMAARQELLATMDALADAYARSGTQVAEKDLFQRAVRALHGEREVRQAADEGRRKVEEQLRNRRGQFTSRPTQRQSAPSQSREQQAVANLASRMKDMGLTDEDPDGFLED